MNLIWKLKYSLSTGFLYKAVLLTNLKRSYSYYRQRVDLTTGVTAFRIHTFVLLSSLHHNVSIQFLQLVMQVVQLTVRRTKLAVHLQAGANTEEHYFNTSNNVLRS